MFNILFVCTGNICRSPMAEGLLKHLLPNRLKPQVQVGSAGTYAIHGNYPESNAVLAMKSLNIDISGHRARLISPSILKNVDLVLCMKLAHLDAVKGIGTLNKESIKLMTDFSRHLSGKGIPDPYGMSLQVYIEIANRLKICIDGLIQHMENTISI